MNRHWHQPVQLPHLLLPWSPVFKLPPQRKRARVQTRVLTSVQQLEHLAPLWSSCWSPAAGASSGFKAKQAAAALTCPSSAELRLRPEPEPVSGEGAHRCARCVRAAAARRSREGETAHGGSRNTSCGSRSSRLVKTVQHVTEGGAYCYYINNKHFI